MQISLAIFIAFSAISRAHIGILHQRAGRGRSVAAAGTDRRQRLVGIDHVTRTGDQKRLPLVGHQQQRLQVAQHLVGAPVLGQLHGGAIQVARVLFELGLKARKQVKASAVDPAKPARILSW